MDSDSEDFVVVGTPLEREEEDRAYRKKVRDLATTRSLPVHKQVPVDAQGRARFHGAFEGGFSAGYFNTVGSKEGWAPSQFRSSRGDRAAPSARVAEDYMDDDEREALQASRLEARDDYDTFGTAAALKAQRQHSAAAAPDRVKGGGGIIPGPVPSDLVVPVSDPKAQRLLRRMGWRPGKGIGRKHASRPSPLADDRDHDSDRSDAEDDALPAALADDVRGFVLVPKTNLHGVGYDPFEGAEEFRVIADARRRARDADPRGMGAARPARGQAFGVGVFEEDDPEEDAYRGRRGDEVGYAYEIDDSEPSDDEFDRGVGAHAGASGAINGLLGDGERANDRGRMGSAGASGRDAGSGTAVRGFALSGDTLAPTRWYPPPTVPRSFTGRHVFSSSATKPPPRIKVVGRASATPTPPAPTLGGPPPPPPADAARRRFVDVTAHFVAKNGPSFETLARERQRGDAKFAFLFGGAGSAYYAWRLARSKEEIAAGAGDAAAWVAAREATEPTAARPKPLDADERARMLGETPLETTASRAWENARSLSTAPPPGAPREVPPPPPREPERKSVDVRAIAEGDRSRIRAALSSAFTSGSGDADANGGGAVELKPGLTMPSALPSSAAAAAARAAEEAERDARARLAPIASSRTSEDWAPAALVCKRFDVADPFADGTRARPSETTATFRSDEIVLTETDAAAKAAAPAFLPNADRTEPSESATETTTREVPPPPVPPGANAPRDVGGWTTVQAPPPPSAAGLVPPPPPPPPPVDVDVEDEAEAFLRGLFFKKAIFEDEEDEAAAEARANAEEDEEKPPPPRVAGGGTFAHHSGAMEAMEKMESESAAVVGDAPAMEPPRYHPAKDASTMGAPPPKRPASDDDDDAAWRSAKKRRKKEKKAKKRAKKKSKKKSKKSEKRSLRDESSDSESSVSSS